MVMPRPTPPNYEVKYADFIRICSSAKKSGLKQVVVSNPSVIGYNYEEIVESLSRLAMAGLALSVVQPEQTR